MLGQLPWRIRIIFLISAISFNFVLVWGIVKINEYYRLRHYSSDEYYQLQPADDFR